MSSSNHSLKRTFSRTDKILEAVGLALMLVMWGCAIWFYTHSPEVVPTHFTFSGKADGFGGKTSFFTAPAIASGLYLLLSVIAGRPRLFNYPVAITAENAQRQYNNVALFLRALKICILILFILIEWHTFKSARGQQPGNWVFGVALALVQVPVFWFLIRSVRNQ